MKIIKSKLKLKAPYKKPAQRHTDKLPLDNVLPKMPQTEIEKQIWFNCNSIEDLHGPVVIYQQNKCIAYDKDKLYVDLFTTVPTKVSQVFILSKIINTFGIANNQDIFMNCDLEFKGYAVGLAEGFSIEHNDHFIIKSSKNQYLAIHNDKVLFQDQCNTTCFFSILAQTEIVKKSRKTNTLINPLQSTLGMPMQVSKYD